MVSLHGLAGDPISYMDKYAGQVEEFMKLCFPNGTFFLIAATGDLTFNLYQ